MGFGAVGRCPLALGLSLLQFRCAQFTFRFQAVVGESGQQGAFFDPVPHTDGDIGDPL